MQQMLAVHGIPARIVDWGAAPCLGAGSPTALQVRSHEYWDALLLLSPVDETSLDGKES